MSENIRFIESMYDGTLHPCEGMIPRSSNYWELIHKTGKQREVFLESLSSQQKRMYEDLAELEVACGSKEIFYSFVRGFRLGGQCIYDVFCTTE